MIRFLRFIVCDRKEVLRF